MIKTLAHRWRTIPWFWWVLASLVCVSGWFTVWLEEPLLLGLPLLFIGLYVAVFDYRILFFLVFGLIPLSYNYKFGPISIDLPSEPVTLTLAGTAIIYFARHFRDINKQFFVHPVTLLLLAHLSWTFLTTFSAENKLIAIKFLAAKAWYVLPFYFLAAKVLTKEKTYRNWAYITFATLTFTIIFVLVGHARLDFGFEEIKAVLHPFYPNHVIYASIVALFVPYIWEMLGWYRRGSRSWWLIIGALVLYLVAINFSYTRAAYVAIVAAVGAYWLIRFKLIKYVLILAVALSTWAVYWVVDDNHYLDFAPEYERTISTKDFDKLMEATYKLEDISMMERVHRWVAAFRMTDDRPVLGFGPGNFYSAYRPYTLRKFKTYVSDNPEKSGVHCYFLMTSVEQGYPGLILFVLFLFSIFLTAENAYHRLTDPLLRRRVMANALSLVVIATLLIVNDMIETDKVGAFFFAAAAVIVRLISLQNRNLAQPDRQ